MNRCFLVWKTMIWQIQCIFEMTFLGVDTDEQFNIKIKELLDSHSIKVTDETFAKICPLITTFIQQEIINRYCI